jgi:LemA protein
MAHEEATLTKVTELRTAWSNATTVDEKAKLESELSGALKTIMAVSENYPDLKANQNFLSLQNDLKDTENKVSYARQFYNDTVTMYNTSLEVFPKNFVGSMFKFQPEPLFEVSSSEAKNNVKVDFNN